MKRIALALVPILALCLLTSCQTAPLNSVEPYLLSRADYVVHANPNEHVATIEADFAVRTARPAQRVFLLPHSVAVTAWTAPGADLVNGPDGVILWTHDPGDYRVHLRFVVPRRSPSPGVEELILPTLLAGSGEITLVLPAESGDLTTSPKAIQAADQTAGPERRLRLLLPTADALTLRWNKAGSAIPAAPAFLAHAQEVFQVWRGLVTRNSVIVCEVQRGAVETLRLELPAGLAVRKLSGQDVLGWTPGDDGKSLLVTLARKVKDRTTLRLTAEETLAPPPTRLTARPIIVAGADVQDGSLRLAPAEGLLLADPVATGAVQAGNAADPTAQTYLYARAPASVAFQVAERKPRVAVASETLAVIEAGVLTLQTSLHYSVSDRAIRDVTLELPAETTVLDISGSDVLDWDAAGGKQLTVRFKKAVSGRTDLALRLQKNLVKINGIEIPHLTPQGVESDEGLIGVSAGAGVQLRHHHSTLTEQTEVAKLPDWIRAGGARLAYHYRQAGATLAVATEAIVPHLSGRTFETIEVQSDVVLRTFTMLGQVTGAELFEIPLDLPEDFTPLRVAGPHVADWEWKPAAGPGQKSRLVITLDKDAGGLVFFNLTASRTRAAEGTLKLGSIDLPTAEQIAGGLLVIPRGDQAIKVLAATKLQERPAEALLREAATAQVSLPRTFTVPADSLAWDYTSAWSLDLHVEPRPARLTVESVTLLHLRHGQMAAETVLRCNILDAGVSALRVRLPAGAVNSRIEGEAISSKHLAGDTWQIVLGERRRGFYQLLVTYDRLTPGDESQVAKLGYQAVELLGAENSKGFLLVAKDQPSIDIVVTPSDRARRIEVAALPSWYARRLDLPVVGVFDYSGQSGRDWKLDLAVRLLAEADVLKIQASDCLLQTLLSRDGSALTFMTLTVENAHRQFAGLALPEGRTLWAAYVDGQPVKPVEASEPHTYLIPVGGQMRAGKSFDLTVVYKEQYAPLIGRKAKLTFATPPVDVPTGSMAWHVLLPPEYRLADSIGDRIGNMQLLVTPPEADTSLATEIFSPDASRFDAFWHAVRTPFLRTFHTVADVAGAAFLVGFVVLVFVLVVYLGCKLLAWLARRLSGRPRVVPVARPKRRLTRWAAVLLVILFSLILAAVLLPCLSTSLSPKSARLAFMSRGAYSTEVDALHRTGQSVEQYAQTYGMYPTSDKGYTFSGWNATGGACDHAESGSGKAPGNVEYVARGKKTDEVRKGEILAFSRDQSGGIEVYRKGGQTDYYENKDQDRLRLGAELYNQGDLNNGIVQPELEKARREVQQEAGKQVLSQYNYSKNLKGNSLNAADNEINKNLSNTVQKKLEQHFAQAQEESVPPQGQGLPENGVIAGENAARPAELKGRLDRKKSAIAQEAGEIQKQAKEQAGLPQTLMIASNSGANYLTPPPPSAPVTVTTAPVGGTVDLSATEDKLSAAKSKDTRKPASGPVSRFATKLTDRPVAEFDGTAQSTSEVGGLEDERATHGSVATAPTTPAELALPIIAADLPAAMTFAPVVKGLSKGNLPIALTFPEVEQGSYLFLRNFSGTDVGQFEVTAIRSGSDTSILIIAGLGLLGFVITALHLIAKRKSARRVSAA